MENRNGSRQWFRCGKGTIMLDGIGKWIRNHGTARPTEVGGVNVLSAICDLADGVQSGEITDRQLIYAYRLMRLGLNDLTETLEFIDEKYGVKW